MNVLLLVALAQASPMAVAAVPDPVLADQRGGFRLPSGIDVALTVQTQTAIDGAVVLRTVFQADQGTPSLTIYAPKAGETVATNGGDSASSSVAAPAAAPWVSVDRRNGIEVHQGVSAPAVAVSAGAPRASGDLPAGLGTVSSGATTDNGLITDTTRGGVRTVELRGADLAVTHITGNAFGSAIANSGSDRSIDTQTAVSIDLRNAGPDVLGSAMFRVQDIAIAAAAMRAN